MPFLLEAKSGNVMKKAITNATERSPYMDKRKKAGIILAVILGTGGLLYLGGILGVGRRIEGDANSRLFFQPLSH